STLAAPPSSLQIPLQADVWLLDQPGRTLVRDPDRKADPARNPPQHPRAGGCPQAVRRDSQREPQAIHVDQDRRPDPRQHPSLLPTNFGDRTLGRRDTGGYRLAVGRHEQQRLTLAHGAKEVDGDVELLERRDSDWRTRLPGLVGDHLLHIGRHLPSTLPEPSKILVDEGRIQVVFGRAGELSRQQGRGGDCHGLRGRAGRRGYCGPARRMDAAGQRHPDLDRDVPDRAPGRRRPRGPARRHRRAGAGRRRTLLRRSAAAVTTLIVAMVLPYVLAIAAPLPEG